MLLKAVEGALDFDRLALGLFTSMQHGHDAVQTLRAILKFNCSTNRSTVTATMAEAETDTDANTMASAVICVRQKENKREQLQ